MCAISIVEKPKGTLMAPKNSMNAIPVTISALSIGMLATFIVEFLIMPGILWMTIAA